MKITKGQEIKIMFAGEPRDATVERITSYGDGKSWFSLNVGGISAFESSESLKENLIRAGSYEELTEVEI